jgi:hypothetical protein
MGEISMYEWLKGNDVFTWLKPLWSTNQWDVNSEGKIEVNRLQTAMDSPWVHHGHTDWARCMMWSRIMFYAVGLRMGQHFADGRPFVPSGCQNCYKVVVRPQNLAQLFALDQLEIDMGRPSKCGIEIRQTVHGLYGGYFYNLGLEAGQECYQSVREAVSRAIEPDVPVILKRGCTEMEHIVGPSDKWEVTEEQRIIEDLIMQWVVDPKDSDGQPDPLVWRIKRKWIEYAYQHGDETYKLFTGGKSVVPGYVTYHEVGNDPKM